MEELAVALCPWWRSGAHSAAALCGAPSITFSTRRGFVNSFSVTSYSAVDAITDHGAENVDTAQRASTETFLLPFVSTFLSYFLDCISTACA